ncbi:cysteine desulfurase [Myxococcota bacterium]|nr:cysteine desulfurase [Myxococcota bacterium]
MSRAAEPRLVDLDHNATSPPRPETLAAALPLITEAWGNPGSAHRAGQRPAAAVEEAREAVASAAGARPKDVIFTSGATEANHLALRGLGGRVICGAADHPAALEPVRALGGVVCPVDSAGRLRLDALEALLAEAPTALVSVIAANNETGALQPVEALHTLTRRYGARLHLDAAQWIGRLPLPTAWDLLTLTAHKSGGLKGAGALVVRPDVTLAPQQLGGSQERGRRAGTLNPPAIVSLGVVAASPPPPQLLALQARLEVGAKALGAVITAEHAPRLPNTTHLRFPGLEGALVVLGLDAHGVCASVGAACSSGAARPSHVLEAMGLPATEGVRLSVGWNTSEQDVDAALSALALVVEGLRGAEELFE